MRIGIVSDTHGDLRQTQAAVRLLQSLGIDTLLHCGDIGTPQVVAACSLWPAHYVQGNCDYDARALAEQVVATGGQWHGEFADLTLDGVRIAMLHGDDEKRLSRTIAQGDWQWVCHGHTHEARLERHGPTQVLNPGALHRARAYSVAVIDLPACEATIVDL